MADWVQLTVRYLHILFGVAWVGGAIFMMHAMGALRKLPPQVAGPASGALGRKGLALFAVAGPATVVFGVLNQWVMTGELDYRDSAWNVLMGVSLVLAVAMLAVGFGWNLPNSRKMQALVAKGPPGAEGARLQKKLMMGGGLVILMGLVALGLMVAAVVTRTPRVV